MNKGPLIQIGGSAEEIGEAFVAAWHRAEAGDRTPERPVLVFESVNGFKAAFSDARIEILDALAEAPAPSITALAGRLGRSYRRVHDDVAALAATGAIRRTGRQLTLAASEATVTVKFGRSRPGDGVGRAVGRRTVDPGA